MNNEQELRDALAFLLSQQTAFGYAARDFAFQTLKKVYPEEFQEPTLDHWDGRMQQEFNQAVERVNEEYFPEQLDPNMAHYVGQDKPVRRQL